MPGFDRSGPLGRGAMTGRGMGPCASGSERPVRGYSPGGGRSFGRGFRCFGGGFRRGFGPYGSDVVPAIPEADALKEDKNFFEAQLKRIDDRLKELSQD